MNVQGTTRILGIFGDPVAHSLSPSMQNAALQQVGIDAVYVPFHVRPENLDGAVEALRRLNIWGVNVTVPHKEAVVDLLDVIDPAARMIGAVNTVVNREGTLHGYNTDGIGLVKSLAEDLAFDPKGKQILLLGAGGACRAAVAALAERGAHSVGLANRSVERGGKLIEEFSSYFPGTSFALYPLGDDEALSQALAGADLVINTTSLGLKGETISLPWKWLPPQARIYDMVYRQGDTPFCQQARNHGFRAADGIGMLAAQGEAAFYLWTGREPPYGIMKRRLLAEQGDD